MDEAVLNIDRIQSLLGCLPNEKEKKQLTQFENRTDKEKAKDGKLKLGSVSVFFRGERP